MEEVRSGADSPGLEPSIPMIDADFLHDASKSVEVSPKLPDGQYGTGAVLSDLAGFAFVTRGKEYTVLAHPLVQARLHLPPDQVQQRTAKSDGAQPLRLPRGAGRA